MRTKEALALVCVELLFLQRPLLPQQQAPATPQARVSSAQTQSIALTPGQLDSLVAPIALYPDPILSQVLVASTYPLEIVEAARWLGMNSALQGKALVDAAAKQTWDASVQALVVFPDVLKHLNQDIGWVSDLGNAFLAQQNEVLNAIQRMRQKAENKGALHSTNQQTVSSATQGGNTYIEIRPASPDVVYLPQYDPVAVWGPPEYYPYPSLYYPPPGAAFAAGAISFGVGAAVGAIWSGGWNSWGWNCGWGNHNVVVNNNFVKSNNFNRVNVAGNGNSWVHNPAHRGDVPYSNRNVADRFSGRQGNLPNTRPTAGQIQQGLSRGDLSQRPTSGARPQNGLPAPGGNAFRPGQGEPAQGNLKGASVGDRVGNRSVGAGSGGAGAFAGMSDGGARARMNSSRGFASTGGGFRAGGGSRGGRRR